MPEILPSEKQKRFCQELMIDNNGTQAAIRAGFSKKTAKEQAARLLTKVHIKAYLKSLQTVVAEKTGLTHEWVLNRFKEISDRCMQAEPVMIRNGDGELVESGEYKFDSNGANKATEMIGKHIGFFERDNEQKKPEIVPMNDEQLEKVLAEIRKKKK